MHTSLYNDLVAWPSIINGEVSPRLWATPVCRGSEMTGFFFGFFFIVLSLRLISHSAVTLQHACSHDTWHETPETNKKFSRIASFSPLANNYGT